MSAARKLILFGVAIAVAGYTLALLGISTLYVAIAAITVLMIVFSPVMQRLAARDADDRERRKAARLVQPDLLGEEFNREFDRSRRFGKSFSAIRIVFTEQDDRRSSVSDRAAEIRKLVRGIDRVWAENDEILCVLPETNRGGAEEAVLRLRRRNVYLLPRRPVHIVSFPEDAISVGGFVAALNERPQEPKSKRQLAPPVLIPQASRNRRGSP